MLFVFDHFFATGQWSYHIIYVFAKCQTAFFFANRFQISIVKLSYEIIVLQIVLPDLSHRKSLGLLVTG